MSKSLFLVVFLFVLSSLSGCYAGLGSPVPGLIYADVKVGTEATSNGPGVKRGQARCESFLGLIGVGDCSIAAAKADGGISRIQHVDYKVRNILGVYAEYVTIVSGQ